MKNDNAYDKNGKKNDPKYNCTQSWYTPGFRVNGIVSKVPVEVIRFGL